MEAKAQAQVVNYVRRQEELGIPLTTPDNRRIPAEAIDDTYYLDVSYDNSDLEFSCEGVIRLALDAEGGDVDFRQQAIGGIARTVTCAFLGFNRAERVARKLCEQGFEVILLSVQGDGCTEVVVNLTTPDQEDAHAAFVTGMINLVREMMAD